MRFTPQGEIRVPVEPGVLVLHQRRDEVYYLRTVSTDAGRGSRSYAGFYRLTAGSGGEILFKGEVKNAGALRLNGDSGRWFLLAMKEDSTDGTLYSVDINSGRCSSVEGVLDFILCGGVPVMIIKGATGLSLNFNGEMMPLLLDGSATIKAGMDERILFVSNGCDTEIIDITAMRSLYLYSSETAYAVPGEYNLIIEAVDLEAGAAGDEKIFYRVTVNGIETGRTDTGPAVAPRIFKTRVTTGRYAVVMMERWELDTGKERYVRSNNIKQPGPLRIYMPENLVMSLRLRYTGRGYIHTMKPVTAKQAIP